MSDVYIEDPEETEVGALEHVRAELSRIASQLERKLQSSASGALDETRFLMRKAQHRINSRLGPSALVAICAGVVLGLAAAALLASRSRREG
ncbi:MAG TPA: hypothetical protein VG819_02640 [Rhizomicrobium sp.]|jgi:hypothetical protein|nr:hypothetical protein [Rhizomicrobium sp.]